MIQLKFSCDDRYEAEKLAGLISLQKDGTVYVAGIAAVIDREIVIKLKDKSSHAVTMKDKANLTKLSDLLSQLAEGKVIILSSGFEGEVAEIIVAEKKDG